MSGEMGEDQETEVVNAKIERASIRYDRGVFLTGWIDLVFDVGVQGFGGYVLGAKPGEGAAAENGNKTGSLASWVNGVMTCAGVEEYSEAVGKIVRVKKNSGWGGKLISIGHAYKDIWFDPVREFARLNEVYDA